MAISLTCPKCGQSYQLDDALAGRKGRCKVCGEGFIIPAAASPAISEPPPPTPKPVAPKPAKSSRAATTPFRKQIIEHITKRIGPAAASFRSSLTAGIHLDLHVIPPTHLPPDKNHPLGTYHYTVVTSGLSARPMNVPPDEQASPYAELMIALPGDWPGLNPDGTLDQKVMKDPRYWWPFQWLKTIARLPHQNNTFIAPGHTIPNGEEAAPFASNTQLGCMLVFPSTLSHKASRLKITEQIRIDFYALYPLYPAEMELKRSQGVEPLINRLMESEITELIDPDRPSVC